MRRILLVVLGLALVMSGTAWAQCSGCETMKLWGYMAPNLRMIDSGNDDVKGNLGLGMAYNRVVWSGEIEAGKIVKKVAWRVESDLKENTVQALQYAYVEPKFSDAFSVTFGRTKKPFSLEQLYATANQITADRHYGQAQLVSMFYSSFNYGLMANFTHPAFKVNAGVFDGTGGKAYVGAQDPALDYGARVVITPPSLKGLEIGANVVVTTIPAYWNVGTSQWVIARDQGLVYTDTKDAKYLSNTGMAYGGDINFTKDFGTMNLIVQAEYDMGDNTGAAEPGKVGDTWEDASFYKWTYMYLKARMKFTPDFGIYFGFSMYDPNTGTDKVTDGEYTYDVGENNESTTIIPGLIYYWTKNLRTMVEVQMITNKVQDLNATGGWVDDQEFTNFVLQQVFIWP
jgi:hypothetical protein